MLCGHPTLEILGLGLLLLPMSHLPAAAPTSKIALDGLGTAHQSLHFLLLGVLEKSRLKDKHPVGRPWMILFNLEERGVKRGWGSYSVHYWWPAGHMPIGEPEPYQAVNRA